MSTDCVSNTRRGAFITGVITPEAQRRPRDLRRHWQWLIPVAIVLVDQVTKSIQRSGTFIVNTGGASFVPPTIGNVLWKSSTFGAVTDTVDTALLIAAFLRSRRLSRLCQRTGATMAVAGLFSNLCDRLGAASITHPGLPRGSVDWIPLAPHLKFNIADIFVAVGALMVVGDLAHRVGRLVRATLHTSRGARITIGVAGLVGVAIWSMVWQGNRQEASVAQRQAAARSEAVALAVASQYSGTGRDWLSNRDAVHRNQHEVPSTNVQLISQSTLRIGGIASVRPFAPRPAHTWVRRSQGPHRAQRARRRPRPTDQRGMRSRLDRRQPGSVAVRCTLRPTLAAHGRRR